MGMSCYQIEPAKLLALGDCLDCLEVSASRESCKLGNILTAAILKECGYLDGNGESGAEVSLILALTKISLEISLIYQRVAQVNTDVRLSERGSVRQYK
jgi:hypothetical protein